MSSESELSSFIQRHKHLLTKEREAEIERTYLLLSNCPPKLLEQKGLSLGGLGIANINIGLGGKTLVELERPTAYHTTPIFPPHSLRPGDLAGIEDNASNNSSKKSTKSKKPGMNDVKNSKSIEGVVYKSQVTDTRIVIAVDPSDSQSEDLDLPDRCRIVKLANSVTYDRMEKALDQLAKLVVPSTTGGNPPAWPKMTKLVEVLMGISQPTKPQPLKDITFFDNTLNDSQKESVKFALAAPEVACIHGPPGTGKTHTLIEIIRQLTATSTANPKPLRLLVCGASNLSVDNIVERLVALPSIGEKGEKEKLKITRIGHPARVMAHEGVLDATLDAKTGRSEQAALAKDVKNELEAALDVLSGKGKGAKGKAPRGAERKKVWEEVKALRKEYRQREGGVVETVLAESQIVLATCHSAGSRQLYKHDFDVLIIDEATQAMEAVCWIPIFKAKKLILAGDPMQLPPTILSVGGKKSKNRAKDAKKPGNGKANAPKPSEKSAKEKKTSQTKDVIEPPQPVADDGEQSSESSQSEDPDSDAEDGNEKQDMPAPKTVTKSKIKSLKGLRPPRSLETTLFDRLEKMYGPGIKRMLDVQYRMHEQIAQFPSKVMYLARLKSHPSVASHLLKDLPNTNTVNEEDEKEVLGTPVVFFDTAGCEYFERLEGDGDEGSRCNENEAEVVKRWVEKLIEAGVLPLQIAVITPYQAQVTLLTSLLRATYGAELEIGTVDGMQGREKEAVVISLVRSNDKREVGFLKDKRRLNVAMTRARRHLCIVGDSSTVQHGGSFLKRWMKWLEDNADVRFGGLD
ncbi:P-loop containing nucleoside triphosphate hydrolase protein [Neolentinus lepideus HHB14362 ss-1]|uniref:DNA helicase n=1 Tax=Neolentinus lepideus HHB14362 ss-1 TaxID=1314782 RepID=A0A165QDZ9_9AGAM|nr:P-loop containing nucleoside triphosphate hydrolase protein [Neolentinus lepideus HHB14362 ss-1]